MYFNELKIGMTVDIAPATIEKEKMLDFARDYDNIPLHTDEEYAKNVLAKLEELDLRGSIDNRNEKTGKKIRDAEMAKIPFMLIVGEKEEGEGLVSVRKHTEGDLGAMKIEAFADLVNSMVKEELE